MTDSPEFREQQAWFYIHNLWPDDECTTHPQGCWCKRCRALRAAVDDYTVSGDYAAFLDALETIPS